MKIIFDHSQGKFIDTGDSLLEVYAQIEEETSEYMFDNGWLPCRNLWYQTKSSRLVLNKISKRRQKELSKINITFEGDFNSIVNLVDNIPYYTFMIWDESNKNHSYGILSYYYLINKFYNEGLKYVYISEFYEQFSYKHTLPGFEYWTGTNWTSEYLS